LALTFDAHGTLWALASSEGTLNSIYTGDTGTGAASLVFATQGFIWSLAFDPLSTAGYGTYYFPAGDTLECDLVYVVPGERTWKSDLVVPGIAYGFAFAIDGPHIVRLP
jgi:hypothetical protein